MHLLLVLVVVGCGCGLKAGETINEFLSGVSQRQRCASVFLRSWLVLALGDFDLLRHNQNSGVDLQRAVCIFY